MLVNDIVLLFISVILGFAVNEAIGIGYTFTMIVGEVTEHPLASVVVSVML